MHEYSHLIILTIQMKLVAAGATTTIGLMQIGTVSYGNMVHVFGIKLMDG